jgi:hypothetical protein
MSDGEDIEGVHSQDIVKDLNFTTFGTNKVLKSTRFLIFLESQERFYIKSCAQNSPEVKKSSRRHSGRGDYFLTC